MNQIEIPGVLPQNWPEANIDRGEIDCPSLFEITERYGVEWKSMEISPQEHDWDCEENIWFLFGDGSCGLFSEKFFARGQLFKSPVPVAWAETQLVPTDYDNHSDETC